MRKHFDDEPEPYEPPAIRRLERNPNMSSPLELKCCYPACEEEPAYTFLWTGTQTEAAVCEKHKPHCEAICKQNADNLAGGPLMAEGPPALFKPIEHELEHEPEADDEPPTTPHNP